MIQQIQIHDYLQQRENLPLIDVRTPLEFKKAHIPGAHNLPIFSNEERVHIGTTYKQVSREEAILLGFDYTGSKWRGFIEEALKIAPDKKIAVHCWRGGMRSGAMAWCLSFYGFEVYVIDGGYKTFRNWVLQQFEKEYPLNVLGGMTGSHKTEILQEIQKIGAQMIDLEGLAQHQGSSFGSMNKMQQPSQEHFENELALQLYFSKPHQRIWVEDESKAIGKVMIPLKFWEQMQSGKVIELQLEFEERVAFLTEEYGTLEKEFLKDATLRIKKRLGYDQAEFALRAIDEGRMSDFIRIVLRYYDKAYYNCLQKRENGSVFSVQIPYKSAAEAAKKILEFSKNIYQ